MDTCYIRQNEAYQSKCSLLLLLKELGDGKVLGVCCCLDLPACAKVLVAADAQQLHNGRVWFRNAWFRSY